MRIGEAIAVLYWNKQLRMSRPRLPLSQAWETTARVPTRRLRPLVVAARTTAWPTTGRISGRFNEPRATHRHAGLDIAAPLGTAVWATGDGIVGQAGWTTGGYGNLIIVDHGDGVQTYYAHLQSIAVAVGQRVTTNQIIGRVGSTGHSTGPHLHYEVRRRGQPTDPGLVR